MQMIGRGQGDIWNCSILSGIVSSGSVIDAITAHRVTPVRKLTAIRK